MERAGGERNEKPVGGLLCGLGPWHVRRLTDDPWEGGCGCPLEEVARMTVDQAIMRLVDRKVLLGRSRTSTVEELAASGMKLKYRLDDGRVVEGRFAPRSVCRELAEKAKREEQKQPPRRHRGRTRKGGR